MVPSFVLLSWKIILFDDANISTSFRAIPWRILKWTLDISRKRLVSKLLSLGVDSYLIYADREIFLEHVKYVRRLPVEVPPMKDLIGIRIIIYASGMDHQHYVCQNAKFSPGQIRRRMRIF